ncbi:hypothetical protein NXX09_19120 [Bacteroides uniformis]|nr:hypothetical protein [Bacteroides uniformis]
MDECRRMCRAASHSFSMFLEEGFRPPVTSEKRATPWASLCRACRRHSSLSTRSYTSAWVL